MVSDWVEGDHPERATLELAVVRGLLLDLLTTSDYERVEKALSLYLAQTERAAV